MALTQMQLIQSLGEALGWLERELAWGINPTQLTHLCGRIGELYAAVITNGQMAHAVNQHGYDVVTRTNERISVKTTAQTGFDDHVSFNRNTLALVDRVMVLRIDIENMEVEVLLDTPMAEAQALMSDAGAGRAVIPLRRLVRKPTFDTPAVTISHVTYDGYEVRELETGTIEVSIDGVRQAPVRPVLRELALKLNVSLVNGNGNELNTRQLGTQIIRSIRRSQLPLRRWRRSSPRARTARIDLRRPAVWDHRASAPPIEACLQLDWKAAQAVLPPSPPKRETRPPPQVARRGCRSSETHGSSWPSACSRSCGCQCR